MTILSALGIGCLARWFSALLPSEPHDEEDYYETLGISKNATTDEVRKAYKQKSLALHPDKLAQRRQAQQQQQQHDVDHDEAASAAQFLRVQEAHVVLSMPEKRQLYHALGCSPTRYKFVASDDAKHPQAIYDNLSRASFCAKTRLVVLVLLLVGLVLLQPILIVIKINQENSEGGGVLADTYWTLILIPTWVVQGGYLLLWCIILMIVPKIAIFLNVAEQVCWLTWEVFLSIRWDDFIEWNYVDLFAPLYLVILLRIVQPLVTMRRLRMDVLKMVTVQYLEQHVLESRTYEDLTDDERNELHQDYILVHVPPEQEHVIHEDMEEEDIEEVRVQSSPEFQHAMTMYYNAFSSLWNTILFGISFVVLLVLKLDGYITVSWWIVFIPLWVYLGWHLLSNWWVCCCATVAGEEVVITGQQQQTTDFNDEEEVNEDKNEDVREQTDDAFATAEGKTSEFFKEQTKEPAGTGSWDGAKEKQPEETDKASSDQQESQKEETSKQTDSMKESETRSSQPQEETKEEEKEGDEQPEIHHIDEETYRQWQSAYQEAESSALEAQAKAQGKCCLVILQLTTLCVLVGKLEQDYQRDEGEDVGYNAVWIIFPILLVAGVMVCCCACLIYGAGQTERLDHAVERVASHDDDDEKGDATANPTTEAEDSTKNPGEKKEGTAATPADEDIEAGGHDDDHDLD